MFVDINKPVSMNFSLDQYLQQINKSIYSNTDYNYFIEWHKLATEQLKYIAEDYQQYNQRLICYGTKRYEVFDATLYALGQPYSINFDIENVKEHINQIKPIKDRLSKIQKDIYWTKPSDMDEYNTYNQNPIIVVPNPFLSPKSMLIDGNHRLAYCLNNNIRKITYCYLTYPLLNDFIFRFDFVMYYYIKNVNIYIKQGVYSEKELELIQNSVQKPTTIY